MKSKHQIAFWIAITVVMQAAAGRVHAQTVIPAAGPTLAELQMRLKHAQSETELDPKHKQSVIELYQSAIQRLELADEAADTVKKFKTRMESIARELRLTKQKLAALPEHPTFDVAADEDIDALERRLEEHRKYVEDPEQGLRAKADAVKMEVAARKTRLEEITRNLVEAEERLAAVEEQLDAPVPSDEPHEVTQARQALLQIRRMRGIEERMALIAEQEWCESDEATNLLRAHHDLAARNLAIAEAEVKFLEGEVDQRRGSEADQRVGAAELAVEHASPLAKPVTEINRGLAVESRTVAASLHDTTQRIDSTQESLTSLKSEFDQSRTMVKAVGLTESLGLLLRQQRAKLSDTRGLHSRLVLRGESVRQAKMRLFEIEAELVTLSDLEAAALNAAQELTSDEATQAPRIETPHAAMTPATRQLADEIKPLLEQRRELLDRLNDDYKLQFEKLVLLDNDERKLLEATREYAAYIDERVLWIRTGAVFGTPQVTRAVASSKWLLDRNNWRKVADALQVNFHREPLPYAFALATILCWLGLRWTMRGRLRALGKIAADDSCHSMSPTLQAVALTVLLSVIVPASLVFVGWRLDHSSSTSKFVHAVGVGMFRMATFAAPLVLLRRMVSRHGLAEKHFEWSQSTLTRLRHHLIWFLPIGILLTGLVGLIEASADEQRLDSLGRLAYLVFAGLLAFFCLRAFPRQISVPGSNSSKSAPDRRSTGALDDSTDDGDPWMQRLIQFGTILLVTFPLGLLILGWSGYFYTALQLTWRMQASAWLVMGLVLLNGSIRRWITLERRHMAVLQAEELKVIAGAGQEPGADGQSPFLLPRWTWPDFRLNLTQIVSQVRSLLDTGLLVVAAVGLWFVWADVTPALNILNQIPLWQTTIEEAVQTKGADDKMIVQVIKRPMPITAAHLGMALLVVTIAAVAGRNIPGLVEVILLEHLSVDAGVRFATTYLVRYIIFTAGACLAFHQIGIGWNNVQWLVAAASVGLGFGLQEIFENFVSGIILLFERPMRVGDVVTVGTTTGTVSKIRFRATTIVDGDRKELIVPNRSFITGNLLNWTLSDSINRVGIKVTVAYGANPEKVRSLLLKIASEHPALLKDPAPSAILEELGDSALVFQLRGFLPSLKDRQRVTHELNASIHNALRIARIQIPSGNQESETDLEEPRRDVPITDLHGSLEAALQRAGVKI